MNSVFSSSVYFHSRFVVVYTVAVLFIVCSCGFDVILIRQNNHEDTID